ncbi:nucleotidyltransferase domain-containing protein [Vibrio rotiferianus]|uniref:nucleotidyltransferase domain-containing protein n=1 Tax=Vibrio rotiferianus TaxID=190895 RepID=UPI00406A2781
MKNNGLDHQGYIINPCSQDCIQPEFSHLIETALQSLKTSLAGKLHSVYLYGSIAKGSAIPFLSDLDLSLVFNEPIRSEEAKYLAQLSLDLQLQFPIVSKIDFDPGHIEEIVNSREKYRWQFWLKHCCCCIWGEDLSVDFCKHKPDIRIAYELNHDLAAFVTSIENNSDLTEGIKSKSIAKKILRTAYYLIAREDDSWHTELQKCSESLLKFYPDDQQAIHDAMRLAVGEATNSTLAIHIYQTFGTKLAQKLNGVSLYSSP